MLENLPHINPLLISDENIKSSLILLLNLVESQQKQINELKEINQKQADEIARLKGEQGKPNIRPQSNKDYSSEKNRAKHKKHKKTSKKDKLTFDNKVHCSLDKTDLPGDLVQTFSMAKIGLTSLYFHVSM